MRQSEELYRTVVEVAVAYVFLADMETKRIIECNDVLCGTLGYTNDEVRDLTLYDIMVLDPGGVDRTIRLALEESRHFISERQYQRKDGSLLDVEVNVSKISLGERQAMCVVAHEVTEHKGHEDSKTNRIQEAALRTDISDAFNRNDTLRAALQRCTESIIQHLSISSACIWTLNSQSSALEAQATAGLEDETAGAKDSLSLNENIGVGCLGVVLQSRRPYISNDVRTDPKLGWKDWAEQEDLVATACYPLIIDGQPVGAIALFSKETFLQSTLDTMPLIMHSVAQGVQRKRTEENLRESVSVLLALREAGYILGSTLEQDEIISRLLQIMQRVSNLTATIISVPDEYGRLHIWRSVGVESLPSKIRYASEADHTRQRVLKDNEQHLIRLKAQDSENGDLMVLCLPIRMRDRIFGVLEAYGTESLAEEDMTEILGSLAGQAASALENARLYKELGERERRLQDLVERLLGAQEEERRRVAYEVHDGLAQVAAAAHQHLQAFARRHQPTEKSSRNDLELVSKLVKRTVSEARGIIAHLRPTTLDDFGLQATISLEVENLREKGYSVEYKDNLGDERLPTNVEIAFFRATQEALTNVRKHARTRDVSVELWRENSEVHLEVRDYGSGFDPASVHTTSGPGERVGLAGMRERINIVGGRLEINSRPDSGTSVVASIPVRDEALL